MKRKTKKNGLQGVSKCKILALHAHRVLHVHTVPGIKFK